MTVPNPYRSEVVKLYKTLLYMGREYPLGYPYFRDKCHRAFKRNSEERDPEKIQGLIRHADFIVRELTSLYYLKKYRTLKRRYYPEHDNKELSEKLKAFEELERKK